MTVSYKQAMRWQRTHRHGTRQPLIASTGSGFWPSMAFLQEDYWPYVAQCERDGVVAMSAEDYYNKATSGNVEL